MGKRKRSEDKDYHHILRKVKRLESKLRKRRISSTSNSSESDQWDEHRYKRYYDYGPDIPGDDAIDVEDEGNFQPLNLSYNYTNGTEQAPSGSTPPPATAAPIAPTVSHAPTAPPAPSAPPARTAPTALTAPPAPAVPHALAVPAATPAPAALPAPARACPDMSIPGTTPAEPHAVPFIDDIVPPLDSEILQLLGEDPATEKSYGDDLQKDIASRWAHILSNGLTKESRLELVKQYLPPKNCPNMAAPKLNLEIKAALSEINVKKDLYSQSKQSQLSVSLAAIGQVFNWALSPNSNVPQSIIKALSDAARLICDNHFKESQSRRYSALNSLNRNIRDTVKNTKIDEHLFGAALADHIRSSKAINKTGSEMKPPPLRSAYRIPPIAPPQQGTLNLRGAPPRTAAAAEPRSTPAQRRPPPAHAPPRERRAEAPRARRPMNTRRYHPMKRR